MKKILSLLLLSSPLFSMKLDIVRFNQKASAIKHVSKNMYDEPKDVHANPANMRLKSKSMHIEPQSVFVPNKLGTLKLSHGKKGFCVHQDDKKHIIQKYFTDPTVRNMTKEQLKRFLEIGYLSLNQLDNGEFSLKANGRINGGGPVLGAAAYWVTKSLCYAVGLTAVGVTVAAGGAAVVATGGTAAPVLASATTLAGGAVTTAVGTTAIAAGTGAAIATTTGVVTVTAATGGLVVGAAGATAAVATGMAGMAGGAAIGVAAVETTAAVVTSAGGIAATVAGIESVSLAVGTFFGMLPTP